MPAPDPQSVRPAVRSSRVRSGAIVLALIAVGVAARGRETQGPPPAPPQPAAAATATVDTAAQDTTVADSMAMQDSAVMVETTAMPEAAPAVSSAPAAWPTDPATGQTLINGTPVVGRVFIMRKTDGTVKYPNVADVVAHEAMAPLPAVVGASHVPAPATHIRRMRGIMIQSTLWDMDTKRSAVERRHYRAVTPMAAH